MARVHLPSVADPQLPQLVAGVIDREETTHVRTRIVLIVALSAGLMALAGCGGSESSQSAKTSPTTSEDSTASTVGTTETATTPESKPKPRAEVITIRVVGGTPKGGIARPSVKKNDRVVLVVHSDTADEMHLHGYDLSRAVAAGGSARLAFVAKIQGRFELELEDSGVQLAELTVR